MANPSSPPLTPLRRLFRLLGSERRDIGYLYVYAVVSGIIALSLPLGVQAIIGLISGGLVFSSVYVLIGLVVLGTLLVGLLQIAQISIVEILQRRVFAKAALEFAYRIPRLRPEALDGSYPPELMNRFFDVLTIQKGLPKVLIDCTAAGIQIVFGVILLSAYHPTFLAFGVALLALLVGVIRLSGPRGLETSLAESKYKYKVAQWLEDLAHAMYAFKDAGRTPLAVRRADELASGYLGYREKHYHVLLTLYGNAVAFKTLLTAALLGLGTVLVVERQINLGQFVAAELVIVLVMASVEKLINAADTVFDLLTAVEKIGYVTDLPLESETGLDVALEKPGPAGKAMRVDLNGLTFRYPEARQPVLNGLDLRVEPGERVALTGFSDSGRHTLLRLLAGMYTQYEGNVRLDGFSLRELNPMAVHTAIGHADGTEKFFTGTLLENLTMGRPDVTVREIQDTLVALHLDEAVARLPQGLNTPVQADGAPLSVGFRPLLLLVRAAAGNPRLLLVGSWVDGLTPTERQVVMDFLTDRTRSWTLVIATNEVPVLEHCDRAVGLKNGRIVETELIEK